MRAILITLLLAAALPGAEFKAGFGRAPITPTIPIAMSGYAARAAPSQGAVHDLWVKALALEDPAGERFVIVTLDLSTVPRNFAEEIAGRVKQAHGLTADRLLLNCSHTHAGQVIRANIHALPEVEGAAAKVVTEYTRGLIDTVVKTIGAALGDLSPARLAVAHGQATFAANRREPTPKGYKIGYNPAGPTDHDVPVVAVTALDGKLRGVLFGYACHNTTLGAQNLQLSGDYAGFAQAGIEARHPGVTALFLQLCGADQNPRPRGTMVIGDN
jgi:neutral ceramidase